MITHTTSSDAILPHVENAAAESVAIIAIGTSDTVTKVTFNIFRS